MSTRLWLFETGSAFSLTLQKYASQQPIFHFDTQGGQANILFSVNKGSNETII